MTGSIRMKLFLAMPLVLAPTLASAHTGLGDTAGLLHGFMHPIGGLDHILAMVMVGVFAFQLGGRARWALPAAFVGMMAVGGLLGMGGIAVPFVELGIALSVIVLGTVVAFGVQAPVAAAIGVVGLFAIFHGHAHGAEMPENAAGLAYGVGFMAATALLHLTGLGGGLLLGMARHGRAAMRTAGGLAAVAGLGILAGVV
ncbi:MAG: HupE/UreJ family protein [Mesorhizobium sp.]|jgi:urease accessory protein